jgi:hypothetical protein
MSTPNFHNKNASRIFAVRVEEHYELDPILEDIQRAGEERFDCWVDDSATDSSALRSYPSTIIGYAELIRSYKEFDVRVILEAVVRSGYYGDANLDWNLKVEGGWDVWEYEGFDRAESILRDDLEQAGLSRKAAIKKAGQMVRWVEESSDKMIKTMEKIFAEHSQPLVCRGVFSNGEAIYEESNF